MKVAILSGSRGWHTDELERALGARGVAAVPLPVDALVGRVGATPKLGSEAHALDAIDAVLVRTIPRGSLDQIIFRVDALHRLDRLGIPVINPATTLERTIDKFYTSTLLEDAGIPTPPTVVAERMRDAMTAFREFGDVVVKPLFGSNGRGMVRLADEETAYRVFKALELSREVYYIQRTVAHAGRDVRAFVVGGRVVSAAARTSTGWRTNVSRGGSVECVRLPEEWAELSVRAAALVGAEYAGVDLLPAESGQLYVLEVNGIPGWRGLQSVTDADIAAAVVEHVLERAGAHAR